MKKKLFSIVFILLFACNLAGCGSPKDPPTKVINEADEIKIQQDMENLKRAVRDVYFDITAFERDKVKEDLFKMQYTNKWISFNEMLTKSDAIALLIQDKAKYSVSQESNILFCVTLVNDTVTVECKQDE